MSAPASARDVSNRGTLRELVICSLEPWDDVWRRNQFFADMLLSRNPDLRILFVEPAADVLFDLWSKRVPTLPRFRSISSDRRLRAFRPLKPLPRRLGPAADFSVVHQVLIAARALRLARPTLWINDVTYATLLQRTDWPSLYDVTDDWLLAPLRQRELGRLRGLDELAIAEADEVVVCSKSLAVSRGREREISIIPNAVDIEHFRRPRARPHDLPESPVAVYVGSLHDARIDVDLVGELARGLPQLTLVFVGPNSLEHDSQEVLNALANVRLLGPRPYRDVPAYLQHADIVIVPHVVSPFTESLDPIKAYECLVIDTPTVATPVAGFRDHPDAVVVAARDVFVNRVESVLAGSFSTSARITPPDWRERSLAFEDALRRASTQRLRI